MGVSCFNCWKGETGRQQRGKERGGRKERKEGLFTVSGRRKRGRRLRTRGRKKETLNVYFLCVCVWLEKGKEEKSEKKGRGGRGTVLKHIE